MSGRRRRDTGRSAYKRAPASSPQPGETESPVVYGGAGATSVVGWVGGLLARPKEAGANRHKRRQNTSEALVGFLRDRRKQEKTARLSAAAKGIAGEPNNKRRRTPDKKLRDRRELKKGVSGGRSSRDRRRRKPIAKKKREGAKEGVPTDSD